ncbi:mechanosensitive ion channel [Salinibacterium sp. G-O1]|uniref:mechanosensitive ion channel family protein n=1 Tax=Salinibacterium sp. G-O1 TaxID=3046208 RepID=UPI0024BA672E|nr:mechanosensitive ion channel domain-containing protein [Salinibacterium sp. G-O1]MDJ0333795.1 mechanosensitive ion channel [Salinibacterium sp. G-O1]
MLEDFVWQSWLGLGLAVLIALIVVVIIIGAVSIGVRAVSGRYPGLRPAIGSVRRRSRLMLAIVGVWIAVSQTLPAPDWQPVVDHGFRILAISTGAWLLAGVIGLLVDHSLTRYPIDVPDNRVARRVRTQVMIIRRLGLAVIVLIAVGSILLTFPSVQAVGASLLASAGVASIVAGLAAQSTLASVFAGMQLAFSDAIRVDDVVVANSEWGRIEELTLTYVVLRTWDERRVVLPSTYFTTTPFENWTRKGSALTGAILFDLDWRVNIGRLRDQLDVVLSETELFDGRVANVQVTDATGGLVSVRVLVSASDAGRLWDLRCLVREQLVDWLQKTGPAALPRNRVMMVEQEPTPRSRATADTSTKSGLFSGTPEAEARGQEFTGAITVPVPTQ